MSQRGEIELRPEKINLSELAGRIIPLYEAAADQKQITISSSVPSGLSVLADGNMLQTVLRNLISNAIKFTPAGGSVSISALPRDHCVEITVSDTGIGIKPENMGKLFSPGGGMKHQGTAGEKGSGWGSSCAGVSLKKRRHHPRRKRAGKGVLFHFHPASPVIFRWTRESPPAILLYTYTDAHQG
jgi:K+-sensing histidine kinase KdpD